MIDKIQKFDADYYPILFLDFPFQLFLIPLS